MAIRTIEGALNQTWYADVVDAAADAEVEPNNNRFPRLRRLPRDTPRSTTAAGCFRFWFCIWMSRVNTNKS